MEMSIKPEKEDVEDLFEYAKVIALRRLAKPVTWREWDFEKREVYEFVLALLREVEMIARHRLRRAMGT